MISNECLIQVRRVDDGRPKYGQTFYNNGNLNNIPENTGMIFSKSALTFYPLEKYSNILDDEHMMLLVEFAEQIRENNAALQYFQVTLPFNKFSDKLREICEIYYRIFQFLKFNKLKDQVPNDTKQKMNQCFGTLHDYRNALNHNPINNKGWIYPKGTFLKDVPMTQQQAIKELFNMLEFAYHLEETKRKSNDI